jgi:eukaryotic-like serine/threonine-protein kinase
VGFGAALAIQRYEHKRGNMTPERWQEIKGVLHQALELKPGDRAAFLDRSCLRDSSLRQEVEVLLTAEENVGAEFLNGQRSFPRTNAAGLDENPAEPADTWIGRRVGTYEIVEQIGEGGMGEVYRAFRADDQYQKQVALKVMRAGQDLGFVISRFKNERQILASLDHPNIACLHDGGTTEEGTPYFVMEFIDGRPIDEYCDHQRLVTTERLKLFLQVCSAVQYAHQRLIIHRDIKPSNVLVTAEGVPKLLDFGIAKILDRKGTSGHFEPTLTAFQALTPSYASPEQMKGEPITTASDVYSLGVVLFELLTGLSPYAGNSRAPHELARAVCELEPERLSTMVQRRSAENKLGSAQTTPAPTDRTHHLSPAKLSKRLSGDLDNIVLMALRKEPQRRYKSVEHFAEDIRRHLENLPVIARRDTLGYRTGKFVSRHKAGVGAAATMALMLLVALAATIREAHLAERRFNDVRSLASSLIFEVHDSIRDLPGSTPARKLIVEKALQYLDSLAQQSKGDAPLRRELAAAYRRIGDVQGYALESNLGETQGAITSYKKSLALWQSLARAAPNNIEDQLNLAYVHRILSDMFYNTGTKGAREELLQAIAISDRLVNIDSSNAEIQTERITEYKDLGDYQDVEGRSAEALVSYRNALAAAESVQEKKRNDRNLQQLISKLQVKIGNELATLGFRSEALQINQSGLDSYQALAQDPTDSKTKREMAVTMWFRGNILMMDGSPAAAQRIFKSALSMVQAMEKADSQNVVLQLDAAGFDAGIGWALTHEGRRAEGLLLLQKSTLVLQQHLARDPSYRDIPYWLGQRQILIGETLAEMGRIHDALDMYRKGLANLRAAAGADMEASVQCDIAAAYLRIGDTLAILTEQRQAAKNYQEALDIVGPLTAVKPPNILALYVAADAYFGMGKLSKTLATVSPESSETKRKHWSEARDWYEKSADAWRQTPHPGRVTPSGFDCGSPVQVTREIALCSAMLGKSDW